MKKLTVLVASATAVALALTACGSAKPQEPASTAATEATTAEVVVVGEDTLSEDPVAEEPAPELEKEPEHTFADILPDHPAFEAVESAMDKGLLEGFIDGPEFQPDEPLENVDIPLLFWNLAGRPEAELSVDIANLDELNEEEAMAAKWYYGAYRGFMFSQGKQPSFIGPKEPATMATLANALRFANERLGGEYHGEELADDAADQEVTRVEAIEMVESLTQTYPVGTEFAKDLTDESLALINPPAPAKEEPKTEVAKTEPAPNPKETQQTVPPPATTPTPEEIAAAQAAAAAQAQAAAEAAAQAQAQAEAEAQAAAQAAAAQAAGSMSDAQWVRDQIASTADAYGLTCSQPVPNGAGGLKIVMNVKDPNSNRKWYSMSLTLRPDGSWKGGAFTVASMESEIFSPTSIDDIKNFIATHAY